MSLWKLRFSLIGTVALIIGLSTLFFTVILSLAGVSLLFLPFIVIVINIVQWLIAPYLIDAMYRVKEVKQTEDPALHATVDRLSKKSRIKKPRVMKAKMPIPNAFAYGSPIAGTRVAVTTALMKTLDAEEVEAVVGHELGHLKHRDVQVMMFVSILPAIFYFVGYSMLLSSMFNRRDSRDSGGAAIIGIASIAIYWVLTLFTLYLSRLREYFADRHSASIVEGDPRQLPTGLAKIVSKTGKIRSSSRQKASTFSGFKTLFISDPDKTDRDAIEIAKFGAKSSDQQIVERLIKKRITTLDRIIELLSTHPNITKRLWALQSLKT